MDKICLSGSLALLWRKDVDVGLMSYSQNHIDVEVVLPGEEQKWRFTGFYGFSEQNLRYRSWDLLRDLQGRSSLPWVVGGDFNEILADVEKSGGGARSPGLMNAFREVFSDCGLRIWIFRVCRLPGRTIGWSSHSQMPSGSFLWQQ